MTLKKNRCTVFILFVILFTSCTTPRYYIYSPSPPVNPFFKNKGDSKLSANISVASGSDIPGGDFQAAYAFTDHFAVTGAYSMRNEKDFYWNGWSNSAWDSVTNKYRRRIGEMGAGYFTALNPKRNITFNIYGGYSWGNFSFTENGKDDRNILYNRLYKADVKKWYVQPSIHFMPGRIFRVGLVSRFSFVNYSNISTDFSNTELESRTLNQLRDKTYLFVEPTVNFQIGFPPKWLKLDMDLTFCPTYDDSYEDSRLRYRWLSASMGLTFDLSKISNK
jgi:hypothetical protein